MVLYDSFDGDVFIKKHLFFDRNTFVEKLPFLEGFIVATSNLI